MVHGQEDPAGAPDLVQVLSAAAQQMTGSQEASEAETVAWIVAAAVGTVPGAEYAGVSLLQSDGEIISQAVSHDTVSAIDQAQASYREGPCVTALWDEHTVAVDDMASAAERWPWFGPAAVEAGVGSMLSFQLFARENSLGALNLYASSPHGFSDDSRVLGGLFATHASSALGQAQHTGQLNQALASRDVIGQAKGILMERFGLDAEQAFAMLVQSSQQTNLKLLAVAQWLTGSNPGPNPEHDSPAPGEHTQ
ncbi:ANTAR domain-containing protein [Allosaccharopolyspora coralli]|uniref:ANTAR domain-containing protein n=1 Tax=Allosaccharopolyspora coralli TaxID=2665642 RepID=A0A5Q3QET6_9PSEU|nr:GAF and ANTAR domain-containing protein [Allosaccharopolyspora coralli]QGK68735.1 ANTAR domain-containing protein [Allosaccharopolyspora coralli]QGK69969.1 ANTAR domain-containing protein [Allosaccharopolyspora coralli]